MQFQDVASLSEQIAQQISEQIIHGELLEGERIPELRIAQELNVSRGSVREALLLLERTHLIQIYPRRGAMVSEMSLQQVHLLFDSSALVLGYMVQRLSEGYSPVHVPDLEQLRLQLQQYVQAGQSEFFYDAIFQYLQQQAQLIDNPYMTQFYQQLLPSLRRSYFLTLNSARRDLQVAFQLFQQVIDAILIRKTAQATLFMQDFCRHLRNLVLDSLTRMKQIELAWARCARQ
ncbi:GntR family transcriptional regulator [Acinetobacter sp. CAAS 2-6]|uniref:GntR family transcriptional regulator n=1 Tax=Acinetobacter sp. CAAS 2-6 TaxID=3016358 RepID=UPI002DD667D0|nr:GntR family transcriptional regulator [Acinetobacter sp. CAAS 2-6]